MSNVQQNSTIPKWADIVLIPALNLFLALFCSALIILAVSGGTVETENLNFFESLLERVKFIGLVGEIMIQGAFGYDEALGYTLYYTTNFIFTGLAVAVAFHASLFNIGGEGQAYIGGLGVGLLVLALDQWLNFWALIPLAIVAAALFGAGWAYIPARLQAYRGSHIVITTIMFNFIAFVLMNFLLVELLIAPGSMSPETRSFEEAARVPYMHDVLGWFGIEAAYSPLNLSIVLALLACVFVWVLIWHTRWGYAIRMLGFNESATIYSGIDPKKTIIMTMAISGGLAGFVGINEVMGVHNRILLEFTAGAGFTGIAVALMGRAHPVGIVMASLLFGALYQGGAELAFEVPTVTRDLVVAIQGLVILFSGALTYMTKPWIERLFAALTRPGNTTAQAAE